jgi:uncharacterized tellurite resistance protein B-like protein
MIKRLFDFLSGREAAALSEPSALALELAVAALMIEVARIDDAIGAAEWAAMERLLADRFELPPAEAQALVAKAEQAVRRSTQVYAFTQQVCRRLEREARVQIIEMLCEVAYADGGLDPQEDMMLRRIAGLTGVTDRERTLARQWARKRAGSRKARRQAN